MTQPNIIFAHTKSETMDTSQTLSLAMCIRNVKFPNTFWQELRFDSVRQLFVKLNKLKLVHHHNLQCIQSRMWQVAGKAFLESAPII
ncbi:hypothetical protein METBIDRAFT_32511 [Metschnikowia bicuspidata var. bicuspidata NRRL YB-4993]|uniref:Uncharacterized protein n=1 Tax=Metschnikowia bicuspidata var. bicuspidata NRRL YB-4993 TaxID=869754 RepID=A0A1A0H9G6_9ASCO|nr:hypothetical protein METBIDRAFT_32511 [Metschnikowia bicuspidata var. bicuspidata NRRL YB-4993]OBA20518.1 hypothetical protein METBIDRAFT_32511 [Metschnikowia bicuspidata var. bicuspidata NRRL YB-4993]